MATFGDLPVEIHLLIAKRCGDVGHDVLVKFSLLSRYFQSLALPALTCSAELDRLQDDDHKLQLFTHRFAPLHRNKLVTLSLVLGRSQIPAHYSLDDGLDEIFANIISLLSQLKTVHVTISSGSAYKDALEEGDFSLTLKAMERLKYLETITIGQDTDGGSVDSASFVTHMLFNCLPRFKCLKKLTLHRMNLVLPATLASETSHSIHLTHINLQSMRITKNPSSVVQRDQLTEFIHFFSQNLKSLSIKNITLDLPPQSLPLLAPRLSNLDLFFTPNHSHDVAPNLIANDYLEQQYRHVLEKFSRSSSLQSISIGGPVGLAQLKLLQQSGGFRGVFQVNQ
ncbi:hypothetical protein PCANC_09894 [Puccinia coronata f. sp. avenae]|uniref:F-box domain-containing protein n=1 Tax=Puccinia coronata f. sp. avenae TaxID=200324 RepID=A0A2N5RWX6_9BASI|nr:hypothetical protein PCANC_26602 [Puccinia coronata f. sp. avenae]PLW22587.1 hypothetical protein PCASD_14023 [Puccinia coronata f. sp. avenae]PLW41720.1 hypothetical protein PCASD_05689 [Puccinia coronata f. sp. avenae]PLW42438.1 hypothetical protein PCANC_09894 [Puccinia coronata f. sp. avenae]